MPKRIHLVCFSLLWIGLVCEGFAQVSGENKGSLLLVNGRILTMDNDEIVVGNVLVDRGYIVAVGDEVGEVPPDAEIIDLGGRMVIPGLIDSHVHFVRAGLRPGHDMRAIEATRSIAELQAALLQKARALPPGELITAIGGWSPVQFEENRFPTLAELDTAAPDHPVYIHLRANGPAVANTLGRRLLQAGGIEVGADGMIEARNDATAAYDFLKSQQTDEDRQRNTRELMRYANSLGLTMVIDAAGTNRPGAQLLVPANDYKSVLALWGRQEMTVRVRLMFMSWDLDVGNGSGGSEVEQRVRNSFMGFGNDMLRIAGLGEHTVNDSMSSAFSAATLLAARSGWLLQEHSGTAEENDAHILAFEAANEIAPIADLHWSLTHVHEISSEIIKRLKVLGAGITVQNQRFYSANPNRAGPPFRLIVDSGIPVGGGTDSTVGHPVNPWYSLYYMVTGKNVLGHPINVGQKITRLEALRLYTLGSAWFSHDEDVLGSIEVGKIGDLAVLSNDYLAVPEDEILNLSSVLTVVGGEIVHREL